MFIHNPSSLLFLLPCRSGLIPRWSRSSHSATLKLFRGSKFALRPPSTRQETVIMKAPTPKPEYLAIASRKSEMTDNPTAHRKLLILDLNGTLVFRAPHPGRSHAKPTGPRIRPSYPRPYMPSFVEYLLHPKTRSWLDVMIWSSAQPASVNDMVRRCFGERTKELALVWSRDKLGLTADQYRAKVQTLKNLETAWEHGFGTNGSQRHSALSTLLVDDSPHKAAFQPFNHVCVTEYAKDLRDADVNRAAYLTSLSLKNSAPSTPSPLPLPSVSVEEGLAMSPEAVRLARRKEKKRRKRAEQAAEQPELDAVYRLPLYDPTLLALIGVLDHTRSITNVAGWIRAGGLGGDPSYAESDELGPKHGLLQDTEDNKAVSRKLWYEDEETYESWVNSGRRALEELRIPLVDGLTSQSRT
ncbi:hypothetical protein HGRIS_001618 [Hohenbuehelia grisea]|uniref:Mitochondrial import inner membrane translocase subunit TIM50 n=1 Tax=Hohenbuehelia grisea TaxID=104357 RepID=A0ABR3JI10_9AGAR